VGGRNLISFTDFLSSPFLPGGGSDYPPNCARVPVHSLLDFHRGGRVVARRQRPSGPTGSEHERRSAPATDRVSRQVPEREQWSARQGRRGSRADLVWQRARVSYVGARAQGLCPRQRGPSAPSAAPGTRGCSLQGHRWRSSSSRWSSVGRATLGTDRLPNSGQCPIPDRRHIRRAADRSRIYRSRHPIANLRRRGGRRRAVRRRPTCPAAMTYPGRERGQGTRHHDFSSATVERCAALRHVLGLRAHEPS